MNTQVDVSFCVSEIFGFVVVYIVTMATARQLILTSLFIIRPYYVGSYVTYTFESMWNII